MLLHITDTINQTQAVCHHTDVEVDPLAPEDEPIGYMLTPEHMPIEYALT